MPNNDKTGPNGQGPRTGRQMGDCDNAMPLAGRGFGQCGGGMRRGFRGNGFGCRRQVSLTADEEKKILEADLKDIESSKEAIQKRLKEL